MHTSQQIVHAEIGDENSEKGSYHVEVITTRTAQGGYRRAVERNGIDHERDKCPRLLGVPRPVVTPRHVGPDSTQEDTNG